MAEKQFPIADVLSITSGRLVSPRGVDALYDVLGFMTGEQLFTHQLGRAAKECKPALFEQFPVLDSPEVALAVGELVLMLQTESGQQEPDKLIVGWVSKLTSGQYGVEVPETLSIQSLPAKAVKNPDPLTEMVQMAGADRVIVVELQ